MSTAHVAQTFIELIVVCLIVVGYLYEDELIDFENKVKELVIHNIHKQKIKKGGFSYGRIQK